EDGRRECRLRPSRHRTLGRGGARRDRARARARRPLAEAGAPPGPALGRREAAHRDRAGPCEPAEDPHRRRADRKPRSGDELGDHQAPRSGQRARYDASHGDPQRRDRQRAPPPRRPPRSRDGRARRARGPVRGVRRLEYVATTAAQGFWRNPVMSLASTFTIGLMLLLFAFFLATDRGLQAAVNVLESKVELALFLEDGARVSDVLALRPRIVDKLLTITRVLSFGGLAVLAMMLIVALFVIVNTIRIAVHARRDEIEIMKLVGATDWFVRWPFILEGMLVGALGAVAATAVVLVAAGPVMNAMVSFIEILPLSFGTTFVWQLVGSVFALALAVGGGGAMLSVRAHLAK